MLIEKWQRDLLHPYSPSNQFCLMGRGGHAHGKKTLLTLIHLLAPSQCMEHLQSCLISSGCIFPLFVQLTKSWAVLSRSLLETALVLWVVTEQHKMNSWLAMAVLAFVSRTHDGTGGSQNALPLNVEQPLTSCHTLACLISSWCWNRSAYYSWIHWEAWEGSQSLGSWLLSVFAAQLLF